MAAIDPKMSLSERKSEVSPVILTVFEPNRMKEDYRNSLFRKSLMVNGIDTTSAKS